MRLTKCKICRTPFEKKSISHKVCSPECALELLQRDKAKKLRQERLILKEKCRSRRDWLKIAQEQVNKYVRLRDAHLGCISCNKPATWNGQWHASHFRSVGAASSIRFNLWNIHKSCSICNNWKSGNLSEYEPRLRAKIGDKKVDHLRAQNQVVTYSIAYLQRLIKIAKKKIKMLTYRRNYNKLSM